MHFDYDKPQADNNSDDDGESLDELIELLRASSEVHGEDDAWGNFRKEISQRRQDYLEGENLRKVRCRQPYVLCLQCGIDALMTALCLRVGVTCFRNPSSNTCLSPERN